MKTNVKITRQILTLKEQTTLQKNVQKITTKTYSVLKEVSQNLHPLAKIRIRIYTSKLFADLDFLSNTPRWKSFPARIPRWNGPFFNVSPGQYQTSEDIKTFFFTEMTNFSPAPRSVFTWRKLFFTEAVYQYWWNCPRDSFQLRRLWRGLLDRVSWRSQNLCQTQASRWIRGREKIPNREVNYSFEGRTGFGIFWDF